MIRIYLVASPDLSQHCTMIRTLLQTLEGYILCYPSDSLDEIEMSLQTLETCHVFVGLLDPSSPSSRSYIQLFEQAYQTARAVNIPPLIFQSHNATIPGWQRFMDIVHEDENAQVIRPLQYSDFSDPAQVAVSVILALLHWEQEQRDMMAKPLDLFEELVHLIDWWRYTLLQTTLAERIRMYPQECFTLLIEQGLGDEAVSLSTRLTEPALQVMVLLQAAQARPPYRPDEERRHQLLTKAHVIARGIMEPEQRHEALLAVCGAFAAQHQWVRALAVLNLLKNHSYEALARGTLCMAYAQAKLDIQATAMWEEARRIVATQVPLQERAEIFLRLGELLAQARLFLWVGVCWREAARYQVTIPDLSARMAFLQKLDRACQNFALQIVQESEEKKVSTSFLPALPSVTIATPAESQPKALFWFTNSEGKVLSPHEAALVVLQLMHDPTARARAFCELACYYHRSQQNAQEEALWTLMEETVTKIKDDFVRTTLWCDLAERVLDVQRERAQQYWERAKESVGHIKDAKLLARALWDIGVGYFSQMRLVQAEAWWRDAEAVSDNFVHGHDNATSLGRMAITLVRMGMIDRAWAVVADIRSSTLHAATLHALVKELIERQTWTQIPPTIDFIQHLPLRTLAQHEHGLAFARQGNWQKASQIWRRSSATVLLVAECGERAVMFYQAALLMAHHQYWEEAIALWHEAEHNLSLVAVPDQRIELLREFGYILTTAAELAEADKKTLVDWALRLWNEAIELVRQLRPVWKRAQLLRTISETMTLVGQWEHAHTTALLIDNRWTGRVEALRMLALALARVHQWRRAIHVAFAIKEPQSRGLVFRQLSIALADEHQWGQALVVARAIPEIGERVRVLIQIGLILHQRQDPQARLLWSEAEQLTRTIVDPALKAALFCELGEAWAETQYITHSVVLLAEAELIARVMDLSSRQVITLGYIGAAFLHRDMGEQQREHAYAIWKFAESRARILPMKRHQVEALTELGVCYARVQETRWALTCWQEAEQIALTISDERVRAEVQRGLVSALLHVHQWGRAEMIARQIDQVWPAYDEMLSHVLSRLIEARQWIRAEVVASLMREPLTRAIALCEVAQAGAEDAQNGRQDALWRAVKFAIEQIELPQERVEALRVLGLALYRVQEKEQAKVFWQQAEETIYDIVSISERVTALRSLAETLTLMEEWVLLLPLIRRSWVKAKTRQMLLQLFPLAQTLLARFPMTTPQFFEAFTWVDQQLEMFPHPFPSRVL